MKTILQGLVGSRAHGLHNEDSDYDWRGVFTEDLITHLSPFKKVKNNHWIEGDIDNTSYELTHFIKGCAQCNPNFLELLYSPEYKTKNWAGEFLIKNRQLFLDSERIYKSYKGYASNQYKKMDLLNPNERTPKFVVAYIRSLHNGASLLRHGEMKIAIDKDTVYFNTLNRLKHEFNKELAFEKMQAVSIEIEEAYAKRRIQEVNVDFWENFIKEYYTNEKNN